MNGALGRSATAVLFSLAVGLAFPLVGAETVGGESWTSELRVQTVAREKARDEWNLEIRVFDRSSDVPLLFRSVEAYTERRKDLTLLGLDKREYRFSITVKRAGLESRLEIRADGEPVEYVRGVFENEPRRTISSGETSDSNVLRVGGRVQAPELIRRVEPIYPEEAKSYRVSGVVILEATIDESGAVTRTRVVKGLPFGLSEAAVEAVKRWQFKPATMDGQPVRVSHNVSVEFNLHKSAE